MIAPDRAGRAISLGDRVRVVSAAKFTDCIGHTAVVASHWPRNCGLVFDEPKPASAARLAKNPDRKHKLYEVLFASNRLELVGVETVVVC